MTMLQEAQLRHGRYYMDILCRCERLCSRDSDNLAEATELLDKEWNNIALAKTWCDSQTDAESAGASLCSECSREGVHLLSLRLHPQERLRWSRAALTASAKLERLESQATHL